MGFVHDEDLRAQGQGDGDLQLPPLPPWLRSPQRVWAVPGQPHLLQRLLRPLAQTGGGPRLAARTPGFPLRSHGAKHGVFPARCPPSPVRRSGRFGPNPARARAAVLSRVTSAAQQGDAAAIRESGRRRSAGSGSICPRRFGPITAWISPGLRSMDNVFRRDHGAESFWSGPAWRGAAQPWDPPAPEARRLPAAREEHDKQQRDTEPDQPELGDIPQHMLQRDKDDGANHRARSAARHRRGITSTISSPDSCQLNIAGLTTSGWRSAKRPGKARHRIPTGTKASSRRRIGSEPTVSTRSGAFRAAFQARPRDDPHQPPANSSRGKEGETQTDRTGIGSSVFTPGKVVAD